MDLLGAVAGVFVYTFSSCGVRFGLILAAKDVFEFGCCFECGGDASLSEDAFQLRTYFWDVREAGESLVFLIDGVFIAEWKGVKQFFSGSVSIGLAVCHIAVFVLLSV